MIDPALLVAAVILAALIIYLASGGADFGSGVWELFARGPRAEDQKQALRRAIAPIWEANHVWLIIVIVLLFVCFPRAFAAIMTALHVPLTLMLIGIVLRGSAFAFQSYSAGARRIERSSSRIFAIASVLTPVMLGVVAGAVASGAIRLDPTTAAVKTDFVSEWLAPFPFTIGLLTLALCAYLAAVYMTLETDGDLREDFRRRALAAGIAVGACALPAALLAWHSAPAIGEPLLASAWSIPFHLLTGAIALAALHALHARRFQLARLLAMAQTGLILLGWAIAQYPYLVAPDLTIAATAAPAPVLYATLIILAAGSILLIPAFYYLFKIFKQR